MKTRTQHLLGESGATALIVESAPLVASALARLLVRDCGVFVLGRVSDFTVGLGILERQKPTFAVIDRELLGPDLADDLGAITASSPDTRIVLLLHVMKEQEVLLALLAGAHRCIPKGAHVDRIRSVFLEIAGRCRHPRECLPGDSSAPPGEVIQLL